MEKSRGCPDGSSPVCQGAFELPAARPEERAMLAGDPSAAAGDQTDGEEFQSCLFRYSGQKELRESHPS